MQDLYNTQSYSQSRPFQIWRWGSLLQNAEVKEWKDFKIEKVLISYLAFVLLNHTAMWP